MDIKRIYVAVAATIQVPAVHGCGKPPLRTVIQPAGRQIAQACHAVSMLRYKMLKLDKDPKSLPTTELVFAARQAFDFIPITTIILQARDNKELNHVFDLLYKNQSEPVIFSDENPEYGPCSYATAVAAFCSPDQVSGTLDYLPLWGSV